MLENSPGPNRVLLRNGLGFRVYGLGFRGLGFRV